MNVYTGDVFISNLSICVGKITEKLSLLPRDYVIRRRNVAALMSHYQGIKTKPIYRFGSNIDLISIRTKIAIEGYRQGIFDIYGKGWLGVFPERTQEMVHGQTEKKIFLLNMHLTCVLKIRLLLIMLLKKYGIA
jgi:hypothetical protein